MLFAPIEVNNRFFVDVIGLLIRLLRVFCNGLVIVVVSWKTVYITMRKRVGLSSGVVI